MRERFVSWRRRVRSMLSARPFRREDLSLDVVFALVVFAVAAIAGLRSVIADPSPRWRDCDDAVAIVDRRLPAPPGEVRGGNRAAHILGRIWASRPELHDSLSTNGQPGIAALAVWTASIPDISSLPVASCVDDLAALVDSSVSLSTMRSLSSLLEWTGDRSHGSFYELEANRNAAFEVFVAARSSLLVDPEPLRFVTGGEIVSWAWGLPVGDPAFEAAWNALDSFSVDDE